GNSDNDTSCITFTLKGNMPSSIGHAFTSSDFKIYPNPVTNQMLNVDMASSSNKEVSIVIVDVYGRVQKQAQRAANSNDIVKLNLAGFTPGIYFLKVATADGSATS